MCCYEEASEHWLTSVQYEMDQVKSFYQAYVINLKMRLELKNLLTGWIAFQKAKNHIIRFINEPYKGSWNKHLDTDWPVYCVSFEQSISLN